MKRIICALIALALLLCAVAYGEAAPEQAVIDRFCDTWVDGGAAVEIWFDEGAFHCSATQTDDEGAHAMVWTYKACRYDAGSNSLICDGGTRAYEYFDEASQTRVSDKIIEGLTDSFTFDDQGRLVWNDQEGICKRYMLVPLADAEAAADQEAQAFAGRWGAGRCTIDIEPQADDSFHVRIVWGSSAAEQVEWSYACAYDDAKKQLYTYEPGVKTIVTYAEDGKVTDQATAYEDGQATFTLDGEGMLIWNDAKENAAEGLRFERGTIDAHAIHCLLTEGSFVIQIDDPEGDEGWAAESQDEGVVSLYLAELIEDTFVVRFDPVKDGEATVTLKHITEGNCDAQYTWTVTVKDGVVAEYRGGSGTVPDSSAAGKSEPKTIAPQFDALNTTDATCPAAFSRDDLKDGVLNNVRIFTEDAYDILDVAQMAVGDSFVAEGKTVAIASLETDEAGHININGGMDEADGYTLTTHEDTNGWTTLIEDDFCTYTERGTVNLELAENVTLTDSWDIENAPVTAVGIDDVTKAIMESGNDSFYEHNTELVIEGGKVVEINRRYVP